MSFNAGNSKLHYVKEPCDMVPGVLCDSETRVGVALASSPFLALNIVARMASNARNGTNDTFSVQ